MMDLYRVQFLKHLCAVWTNIVKIDLNSVTSRLANSMACESGIKRHVLDIRNRAQMWVEVDEADDG